ncbi:unnamed protein product [Sphagnum jensenii]|uniref:NPH3 domain-containing protein n=1 Tax=Sphagnum jensenii TaxID=128206 RepID=A0ABP1BR63_9BRYO
MAEERKLSFYLDSCSSIMVGSSESNEHDSPTNMHPGTPAMANKRRMVETDAMEFLEVEVNAGRTFIVPKTPLLARCGRLVDAVEGATMKKKVSQEEASYSNSCKLLLLRVELVDMPGGPEAFEMAVRFCLNMNHVSNTSISSSNVVMLRCAAEFLDMGEAMCKGNLKKKTEDYLRAMVFWSWEEVITVLRSCEKIEPGAVVEKTQLLERCVTSLAEKVSSSFSFAAEMMMNSPIHAGIESYFASYLMATTPASGTTSSSHRSSKAASDTWWFEDIASLSVHLMARVVKAMMNNRASDHKVLAKFLLHYLRSGLLPVVLGCGSSAASLTSPTPHKGECGDDEQHALHLHSRRLQRKTLEEVVSLLGSLERCSVSCRSLLGLRRIALALRAGKACRRELERMIGIQLDKATLDNILITALPRRSSSLYDVDLVLRLVDFFLKDKAEALMVSAAAAAAARVSDSSSSLLSTRTESGLSTFSLADCSSSRLSMPATTVSSDIGTPVQTALTKVGDLMDKYLVEIAADTYLRPSRFLALAESLPDSARESDDGLYRAVDIYLEAHPSINEADASRLFKVISYQKLGAETCKAAAQNPGFPPSFVIQLALVQLRASNEGSLCSSRDTESSLSSTTSKGSPRVGQQTVVHVQCSHFEFTLRQIQPDKKMRDTSRPERTNSSALQCVKKTESRMSSFDSEHSSGKRSRLEMISGFHRLKQLFHSKSRQH